MKNINCHHNYGQQNGKCPECGENQTYYDYLMRENEEEEDSKRVILYGGAFDPITKGHLLAAEFAIKELGDEYDELWLMPCYQNINKEKLQIN